MKLPLTFAVGVICAQAACAQPGVSAGRYHNLAVTADGSVLSWGARPGMREKLGDTHPPTLPQRVENLPPVAAVAAGWAHSSAITRDGKVYEWGFSPYRQRQVGLAHPLPGLCVIPKILSAMASAGHGTDACADTDRARNAQMLVETPMQIPSLPPAVAVAAGDDATAIITRDGSVYCWHARSFPVKLPGLEHIRAIALGRSHGVALRDDGVVLGFGSHSAASFSSRANEPDNVCGDPAPEPIFTGAIAIAAGDSETYALRADGSVWAWGWVWSGYPALPKDANPDNKPDKYVARRLQTLDGAVSLGGGRAPSALTQDGRAVAWNPTMSAPPSRRVLARTGRISALVSYSSVLALRDDGFLCTMGSNTYGNTLPGDARLDIERFVPLPAAKGQPPLNLVDSKLPAPPDLCAE